MNLIIAVFYRCLCSDKGLKDSLISTLDALQLLNLQVWNRFRKDHSDRKIECLTSTALLEMDNAIIASLFTSLSI